MAHNLNSTRRVKIPIGAKFIALILVALLTTVLAIVWNATGMFKKDNLNNIYLSSDLLTQAKAEEVRFWLDSIFKRMQVTGLDLHAGHAPRGLADREILFIRVFRERAPKQTWMNETLLAEVASAKGEIETAMTRLVPRFDRLEAGVADLRTLALPSGQVLVLVALPLIRDRLGRFPAHVVAGVRPSELLKSFEDTGPYSLTLVNDAGGVLMDKNRELLRRGENMSQDPIVQRMLVSPLDREFQEFKTGAIDYLGAYAKVGLGGLGVVSRVEKSIALETGNLLVKRSILIAVAVLSAVFIFTYLLIETIVAPVRLLEQASQKIASGDFGVRVDVKSRDEMFDLALSFNVMTTEIGRKIENLSRINQACQTISGTLHPQKLIEFSNDTLTALLKCGKAYAWYAGPAASITGKKDETVKAEKNWFKSMPKVLERMLADENRKDNPFRVKEGDTDYLFIPIRDKRAKGGGLVLTDKLGGKPFQDEDLYMAGTIATSISSTFENINLLNETADKARMEKELETARHVQDTMFPPAHLEIGALEVRSFYAPAAECGGDWWGCMELGEGKVLLAVGDATGHGAPAAMVTATSKAVCSVLQDFCLKSPSLRQAPHLILQFLNKAVFESTQGKILMTFFAAVLDTKTGELVYANASHDPIYRYDGATGDGSAGAKDKLSVLEGEAGPRLGQHPKASYQLQKTTLSPGDLVLLYTDGLPESLNAAGEEYGDRKFMRSILRHANKAPAEIVDGLLGDCREFTEGTPAHDDITLAVCKFKG